MSTHDSDGVVCVGRGVRSDSTPFRPQQMSSSGFAYASESPKDATTQVPKSNRVMWSVKEPNSKDVFVPNGTFRPDPASTGTDVRHKKDGWSRSKSAKFILQYADVPIEIKNHHLGRPTRASILRNLKRSQSAPAMCSEFSWIQDNRRLCNIRDYYRLYKAEKIKCKTPNGELVGRFLTGARFNNGDWLDSDSVKTKKLYIDKHNLRNVFCLRRDDSNGGKRNNGMEIQGKRIMKDAMVNTDENYMSLSKWHGATWQRQLPQLYQPFPEKYNAHASVVVRAKLKKSEYRDPMTIAIEKKK